MRCIIWILCFVVLVSGRPIPPKNDDDEGPAPTPPAILYEANDEPTTEMDDDFLTLPPPLTISDVEMSRLINLDVGTYSPMDYAFKYFNDQNYFATRPSFNVKTDICYQQYFRCTLSQVLPMPVCARGYSHRGPFPYDSMASFINYCDVLLHNCRVGAKMYFPHFEGYCIPTRNGFRHLDGPPDTPPPKPSFTTSRRFFFPSLALDNIFEHFRQYF